MVDPNFTVDNFDYLKPIISKTKEGITIKLEINDTDDTCLSTEDSNRLFEQYTDTIIKNTFTKSKIRLFDKGTVYTLTSFDITKIDGKEFVIITLTVWSEGKVVSKITYYSKLNTTSFDLQEHHACSSIIEVYKEGAYITDLYKFTDKHWYYLCGRTHVLVIDDDLIRNLNHMLYVLLNKMNYVTKAEDIKLVLESIESYCFTKLNDLLDTVENPFRLTTIMKSSFDHRSSLTNWEKGKQKITEIFKENTYLNPEEITGIFNP